MLTLTLLPSYCSPRSFSSTGKNLNRALTLRKSPLRQLLVYASPLAHTDERLVLHNTYRSRAGPYPHAFNARLALLVRRPRPQSLAPTHIFSYERRKGRT
jgi:hypothetical protein